MTQSNQRSDIHANLLSWVTQHWQKAVAVDDVSDMSGHSGKVYGFTVRDGDSLTPLVIRLAPEGVPHKGSTDVLRQVPLLNALHGQGLRVPAVVDAAGDPALFGVPYLVMSKLPGRPLVMGPDAGPSWLADRYRQQAHNLAAELLASLHAFDAERHLPDWESPKSVEDELDMWTTILHKGKDQDWIDQGLGVLEALKSAMPANCHIGLTHGDFQTNNVLYCLEGDTLEATGVVDWEIANIGPTELDIAWFLMMNDERAWHPVEQRGNLDLTQVIEAYQNAIGREVDNLNWFWALACYRIAAIATLNIRLHRTGRKHDPAWERAAQSVPIMFKRALELLEQ